MDDYGRIWTNLILLRIRRLGVRVPPSAPLISQVDGPAMIRPGRLLRLLALFGLTSGSGGGVQVVGVPVYVAGVQVSQHDSSP
jgi:hypothetical protein